MTKKMKAPLSEAGNNNKDSYLSSPQQEIYYNFAIILLNEFLYNPKRSMDAIYKYSACKEAEVLSELNNMGFDEALIAVIDKRKPLPSVSVEDIKDYAKNQFIKDANEKRAFCGIEETMFFEIYKYIQSHNIYVKSDENYNPLDLKLDKNLQEFIAYVALKSIIGNREYCRFTTALFLNRLRGYRKPYNEVIERKYSQRIHNLLDKLVTDWNATIYTYKGCRGYYASFKLSYEELIPKVRERKDKGNRNKVSAISQRSRMDCLKQEQDGESSKKLEIFQKLKEKLNLF